MHKTWSELEKGDRISIFAYSATVEAIHYFNHWQGNGQRTKVWIYFDDPLARSKQHAGYTELPINAAYILLDAKSDSASHEFLTPCPNCDEDMIFYAEDYMCAWCRETLEDSCA